MAVYLFFDMDGVLAKWNTSATIEDTFVPHYFRDKVEPDRKAFNVLEELSFHNEFKGVGILSARYDDEENEQNRFEQDKIDFLYQNGVNDLLHIAFVPCGTSKRIALNNDCIRDTDICILIDDHTPNLIDWERGGSNFIGIKWLNGINGSGKSDFDGFCIPAHRMSEKTIVNTIRGIATIVS